MKPYLKTYKKRKLLATSKTWTQTLDPDTDPGPDPGPWTRTRTLDPDPGPWTRTLDPGPWTLKNLDPGKPGPSKTWALKNLDPEKSGINIRLKNMSHFRELCFTMTIHNMSYCLKVRVLTDI